MSKRRSRSPRRDLATASAASGLLRALDVEKMQLKLDAGCTAKVLYFADDDIWFEAKPLVVYLEYSPTHVTQTLGIVKAKNKKSLQELLEAKGNPKWVDLSDTPPGYHDLKASYINEPGLYSLIFKSTKPQAQDFQDWVYEEVLTALRRRGSYAVGENAERDGVSVEVLRPQPLPNSRYKEKSSYSLSSLDEARLDWKKDLQVASNELQGVKAQFATLLHIEVQKKKLPGEAVVGRLAAKPPVRFRELAVAAISAYRAVFTDSSEDRPPQINLSHDLEAVAPRIEEGSRQQRLDAENEVVQAPMPDEDEDAADAEWRQQLVAAMEEDNNEEGDILKVSDVMRAAGVCRAVWLPFRSDLSNQLLTLKCAQTQGAFAERRREVLGHGIPVSVHKYRKSQDWPLAWQAVQKTQDLYQKRVRECLEEFHRAAGIPIPPLVEDLARKVAEALRTR